MIQASFLALRTAFKALSIEVGQLRAALSAEIGQRALGDVNAAANAASLLASEAEQRAQGDVDTAASAAAAVGTTPFVATGGTTARSAADRAKDFINVLDYGAVNDGTTDSRAAFQAAINAAAGVGKPLLIDGSYKISSQLDISSSSLTITGSGTITSDIDCVIRFTTDVSNIKINGLTLVSARNGSVIYGGVIYSNAVSLTNIEVSDCVLSAPTTAANGIKFVCETAGKSLTGIKALRNRFISIGRMGIELQNHLVDAVYRLNNVEVTGNTFLSLGLIDTYGQGVSFSGLGKNLIINGNTFNDCLYADIEIVGASNASVCFNVGAEHSRGCAAFSVSGFTAQTTLSFSNNMFVNCTAQNNFYSFTDCIFNNNYLHNTTGFNMFRCDRSRFVGNVFKTADNYCVIMDDGEYNVFTKCTFDNSASVSNYAAVRFYSANVANNEVSDCVFGSVSGGGYYDSISGASRNFFTNNKAGYGTGVRIDYSLTWPISGATTLPDYLSSYDTYVFTGSLGGSGADVIFDRVERNMYIVNNAGGPLGIRHATGGGVTIPSGKTAFISSTYSDMYAIYLQP
jgi:hypothetical protein